ncbi:MAG TPA: hypothetical protein VKS62_01370 [Methylomirabilota bacterium]|nr:hypothetical protein [Methylomirabilota bacterium]
MKCDRCRGSSRPDQARPKIRAPSPPAFGTSITSRPPGASQPSIRRTAPTGSGTCSRTWSAVIRSNSPAANGAACRSPVCTRGVKRRAFAAAAASTSTPATCQPSAAATPSAPPEPHPTSR